MLIQIAKKAVFQRFGLEKLNLNEYNHEVLNKKGLAFVTIEELSGNTYSLRGCIGFVDAVAPLKEIVARAAVAAAFSDPRFPPLSKNELPRIIFEVTVLTKPEEIVIENRWDLPKLIRVGEDGLLVEYGILYSGLLLPQVPIEYNWDEETFLAETCIKAGLSPDCWLDKRVKIKRFSGLIIREIEPNSSHVRVYKPFEVGKKRPYH
ncbi:MAG: AmmeMemoRadiSam system protein A [Sulfolobaceae archaeon]